MQVALLGPEGTYTHQAAEKYFDDLHPEFYPTIREVFESGISTKLVPVENSLGGGVTDTIDLLRENNEVVTGEVTLSIEHALISENDFEEIETVVSHPQALSQCQEVISENEWNEKESSSTADAVEGLDDGQAALASEIAAQINEKNIIRRSVQDKDKNTTRFLILNGDDEVGKKTSLLLEPEEDRPGILHAMLSCFSGHQINLSHIQSRPTKEKLGEYYFYVEAETSGKNLELAKKCLSTYGDVRDLGTYGGIE